MMYRIYIQFIRKDLVSLFISRNFSISKLVSSVNKNDVESIERLALVDFSTEAGVERLEKSIDFANKLMEVNTESIEPLFSTVYERNENIRNDTVLENSKREELMKIAPVSEEFYYVAPLGTFSRQKSESTSEENCC